MNTIIFRAAKGNSMLATMIKERFANRIAKHFNFCLFKGQLKGLESKVSCLSKEHLKEFLFAVVLSPVLSTKTLQIILKAMNLDLMRAEDEDIVKQALSLAVTKGHYSFSKYLCSALTEKVLDKVLFNVICSQDPLSFKTLIQALNFNDLTEDGQLALNNTMIDVLDCGTIEMVDELLQLGANNFDDMIEVGGHHPDVVLLMSRYM